MSFGNRYPEGFVCNNRVRIAGDFPEKVWRQFRTKFITEHAPGWKVGKVCSSYGEPETVVNFRTFSVETARQMTQESWDLLIATLSLMAMPERQRKKGR
jgi:hypothetical protein